MFRSKGYDGVTMDDLVAGMGVGRPSFMDTRQRTQNLPRLVGPDLLVDVRIQNRHRL